MTVRITVGEIEAEGNGSCRDDRYKDFPDSWFIFSLHYGRLSCLSVRHFPTVVPPSRDTRVNDDQSEEMNESDEVMGKERAREKDSLYR